MKTRTQSQRSSGKMVHRKSPKNMIMMLVATVLVSTIFLVPLPVSASTYVACGSTIKASTTLSANIGPCSGNGLNIGASGIILNCAGHTITGPGNQVVGYAGVTLYNDSTHHGITGATIKNCSVSGFETGFDVEPGALSNSSGNTFSKDTANGDTVGFNLLHSSNNVFSGNMANSNTNSEGIGFYLKYSSNNTFNGNIANKDLYGFEASFSSNNTLIGNTADGNTYWGFFLVSYSNNNTLIGNTADGNNYGSYIYESNNNTFSGNTANTNAYGFAILGGEDYNNSFSGNTANSNENYGFYLVGNADGNTFVRNSCSKNGDGGSSPSGLCPNTPTTTVVKCSPSKLSSGSPATCKATVTDTGVGTPVTPSGKVKFTSNLTGTFSSTTCTLSGSSGVASCSVTFTPTTSGTFKITGKYGGDSSHTGSKGTFKLKVS